MTKDVTVQKTDNPGKDVTLKNNGYGRWCIVCGEKFPRKRYGKLFCNSACRQQMHRYRTQVLDLYFRMKDDVETYEKMLSIPELHDTAKDRLERIMVKIFNLLEDDSEVSS